MRKPYLERLKEGILLFDGAMGTMLYSRGVFLNRCYEETVLTNPKLVQDIHREYVEAGAQALETNSFGANPLKLAGYGLSEKTEEINRVSVEIAREIAGSDIYVAGSVGPLGVAVEPIGRVSVEEAREAFKRQISGLLEGGVDLILFETFKSVDELLLAVSVCRELSADIPIQAQFTVSPDKIGAENNEVINSAVRVDSDSGVDVVGMNCSVGPADMLEMLIAIKNHVKKPISIMPNAGFPREVEGRLMYLASPEYFAEYAKQFLEAGASVIGGCCGTTPKHIEEMAKAILSLDTGRRASRVVTVVNKGEVEGYKEAVPMEERSRLGYALKNGEWIVSVELVPPLSSDLSKVIEKARELYRHNITCINIPDGPRASSRVSSMISAIEIERNAKIETILHYCCRDRNLIGMQSDLLGAHAAGLRNLLIITGDPPKTGGFVEAKGVFDVDSIGLTALANRLNHGIDMGKNSLPETTAFVLGVGANPTMPDIEREIDRTYKKKEAGAEYIITQPVFDVDELLEFLKRIEGTGLPVIAGVWPLASYRNALFLNNEVPGVTIPDSIIRRMEKASGISKEDGRREGIKIAREIIAEIRGAVRGVQISPPFGNIRTAIEVAAV